MEVRRKHSERASGCLDCPRKVSSGVLIWSARCQVGVGDFSRLRWSFGVVVGWVGGGPGCCARHAVRLIQAGWDRRTMVRRGEPLSSIERGRPREGGGLLIERSRVPRACRVATDPADGEGGCLCPKAAVRAVPPRLLLLCLLLRSSWLTVEGGRQIGAGLLHRRGGRAALSCRVTWAGGVPTRHSRRLVAGLPSSRVDAVVARPRRDGSCSSRARARTFTTASVKDRQCRPDPARPLSTVACAGGAAPL
jgi:hypothetical protein